MADLSEQDRAALLRVLDRIRVSSGNTARLAREADHGHRMLVRKAKERVERVNSAHEEIRALKKALDLPLEGWESVVMVYKTDEEKYGLETA
jgi:hypothetical protein